MREKCSDCANIKDRAWGLPHGEMSCGKIKERQLDFDANSNRIECVDVFRFRPTDGVLPYSEASDCRYFEQK